jgi:hypothetical protein
VRILLPLLLAACGEPRPRSNPNGSGPKDASPGADVESDAGQGDAGEGDAGGGEVTWYRDVVPIVGASCVMCHRAGGIGPFSMESYDTAAPKAQAMAGAVISGFMPPWTASEECQPHMDARTITDREKGIIVRWAALGAPAGDPDDAPAPPIPETLARVDFEGDIAADYVPSGEDDYRCFAVDLGLSRSEQLVALEIEPGARWMVHHVVLYQANSLQAAAADAAESGPGWTCFGGPGVSTTSPLDSAAVGAWAPGTPVTHYPPGTGVDLTLGNVIVMQVHYHVMNGRTPEPDRSSMKLMFASSPVTSAYVTGVYDATFAIPPPNGTETSYEKTISYTIPISGTLHGVFPHMHLLGRRISLTYTPPGGGNTCLTEIPRWDFEWQQFYFYDVAGGVRLEAGGTLELRCEWARAPGRTVYWGEGSNDEMCIVGLYTTL